MPFYADLLSMTRARWYGLDFLTRTGGQRGITLPELPGVAWFCDGQTFTIAGGLRRLENAARFGDIDYWTYQARSITQCVATASLSGCGTEAPFVEHANRVRPNGKGCGIHVKFFGIARAGRFLSKR